LSSPFEGIVKRRNFRRRQRIHHDGHGDTTKRKRNRRLRASTELAEVRFSQMANSISASSADSISFLYFVVVVVTVVVNLFYG